MRGNSTALMTGDLGKFTSIYEQRQGGMQSAWNHLTALIINTGGDSSKFEEIVRCLKDEKVKDLHNDLAHGKPFSRQDAQALRESVLGKRDKSGILYCLTAHLQPV